NLQGKTGVLTARLIGEKQTSPQLIFTRVYTVDQSIPDEILFEIPKESLAAASGKHSVVLEIKADTETLYQSRSMKIGSSTRDDGHRREPVVTAAARDKKLRRPTPEDAEEPARPTRSLASNADIRHQEAAG